MAQQLLEAYNTAHCPFTSRADLPFGGLLAEAAPLVPRQNFSGLPEWVPP